MSTAHISANKGDFAKTVLMPGDPLRAKFIAETYLEDYILVNSVRGMNGYTGKYKGKTISIMASGMGIASIGIYSYELFNFYDVDNIIRIGSAGAISDDIKLRDIVFGMGACTDSNFARQFELPGQIAPICSFQLLERAVEVAKAQNVSYKIGNLLSSDVFYDDLNNLLKWRKMGVLAVEMESAGLYLNALRSGKNALCICQISDLPLKNQSLSSSERQTSFREMMEIALEL